MDVAAQHVPLVQELRKRLVTFLGKPSSDNANLSLLNSLAVKIVENTSAISERYETDVYTKLLNANQQIPLPVLLNVIDWFIGYGIELMKPEHDRIVDWRTIFFNESYKQNVTSISGGNDILHLLGYTVSQKDRISYSDDVKEPDCDVINPLVTDLIIARAELQIAVKDGKKTVTELNKQPTCFVVSHATNEDSEFRSLPVTFNHCKSHKNQVASFPIAKNDTENQGLYKICSKDVSLDRWKARSELHLAKDTEFTEKEKFVSLRHFGTEKPSNEITASNDISATEKEDKHLEGKCVVCGTNDATAKCDVCEDSRCQRCDVKWHAHSERKMHQRKSLSLEVTSTECSQKMPETLDKRDLTHGGNGDDKNSKGSLENNDLKESPERKERNVTTESSDDQNSKESPNDKDSKVANEVTHSKLTKEVKTSKIVKDSSDSNVATKGNSSTESPNNKDLTVAEVVGNCGNYVHNEIDTNNLCVLCGVEKAIIYCNDCEDARCDQCDLKWHRHKKRNKHLRKKTTTSTNMANSDRQPTNLQKQEQLQRENKEMDTERTKTIHQGNNKHIQSITQGKDKCVSCHYKEAVVKCIDCQKNRCQSCDLKWHNDSGSAHRREGAISLENSIQHKINVLPEGLLMLQLQMLVHEESKTQRNCYSDQLSKSDTLMPVSSTDKHEPCVLCGIEDAIVPCEECGDARCVQCDAKWHRHKKRNKHIRNKASIFEDNNAANIDRDSNVEVTSNSGDIPIRNGSSIGSTEKEHEVKTAMDTNVFQSGQMDNNILPSSKKIDLCVLCGIEDAAVSCEECGDARCVQCDTKWHRHKKRNKHIRTKASIVEDINAANSDRDSNVEVTSNRGDRSISNGSSIGLTEKVHEVKTAMDVFQSGQVEILPSSKKIDLCVLCGIEDAVVSCDECGDARCVQCDTKWHRHKKRNKHVRNHASVPEIQVADLSRGISDASQNVVSEVTQNDQIIDEKNVMDIELSDPGLGEEIEECVFCGLVDGTIACIECKDSRCSPCDEKWHRKQSRKNHKRKEIISKDINPFIVRGTQVLNNKDDQKVNSTSVTSNASASYQYKDLNPEVSVSGDGLDADNIIQKLKSDNKTLIEKINSVNLKLNNMNHGDNQEERVALENEKMELLRKQNMITVRMKAIGTIESNSPRHMMFLPQISQGVRHTQNRPVGDFSYKQSIRSMVVEAALPINQPQDSDVFTDNVGEHKNVFDQEKIRFQCDDDFFVEEAKLKGFNADDIRIAKAQCKDSDQNIVDWLELKYKDFIDDVRTFATNDLNKLIPEARIADVYVLQSLVKYPGNVIEAMKMCVRIVESQICEIHQLGLRKNNRKLTMQQVSEYLYKCNGDVEMMMVTMKRDGIKNDIAERVWKNGEHEMVSTLMKKPINTAENQRYTRLIMAEYGLSWNVSSRILSKIDEQRKSNIKGRELERWILNTLQFASRYKSDIHSS